jgi:hypothetical protein
LQGTDFKPRIDYLPHRSLEDRVRSYLEERGYFVYEATYHSVMPETEKRILSRRYSMTALYLRGRADRVAIHNIIPVEIEWEAKTHANPKYDDLTIELLPLVHHVSKAKLGVRCLYVFNVNGFEAGFWAHQLPRIRQIHLSTRDEYKPNLWHFENLCREFFRGVPVYKSTVNGSGDPFVIFDKSVIRQQKHWQDFIDEVTK